VYTHLYAFGKRPEEEIVIDYRFVGTGAESGDVWDRSLFEALAPGALTPFTNSLLTEVTARAWYLFFDRLGFDPAPRSRVVRIHQGRPYLNLSLSARLDADNAGIEPPRFRIDGNERSLVAWEKPSFLAGLKLGRSVKKLEETLVALHREMPDITAAASAWYQRVAVMRWSQAEILQIMEEIERVGAMTLLPYFAARHLLESAYRRLLALLVERQPQERTELINRALGGPGHGVEVEMGKRIAALGVHAAADNAALKWLNAGAFDQWEETMPPGAFADEMRDFVSTFGHRALTEGEIAALRWSEAPHSLFAAVRAAAATWTPATSPIAADSAPLLAAVDSKQRKEAQQILARIRQLLELQSAGLHAFSFVLAGTRRWALAAGHEATSDHRLAEIDDVFFYELEEVKEMMTGEWNISDRSGIHATAGERRKLMEQWRAIEAACLLWGDREVQPAVSGLPASGGVTRGEVVALKNLTSLTAGAVLSWPAPESTAATLLPGCAAFVAAHGSPIDPLAAYARTLGRPGVVAFGAGVDISSLRVSVDGNLGQVTPV
jgi:pyruvate,water dikinase